MKRNEHRQTQASPKRAAAARMAQHAVITASQETEGSEVPLYSQLQILEAVYAVCSENICLYDQEGRVVQMSDMVRKFLRYDAPVTGGARSLGEDAAMLFLRAEDGTPLVEEEWPIKRLLNGEVLQQSHAVVMWMRRGDGQDVCVQVCGAPVRDPYGDVCGALAVYSDVTEQRRQEQRTHVVLDALLALAQVLVYEEASVTIDERGIQSKDGAMERLLELPARLFACEYVGMVLLDAENEMLHPLMVMGISSEHELYWRNSLEGIRLNSFLDDVFQVARLRAGEIVLLDISQPVLRDQASYRLVVPILKGNVLMGMLMLSYGSVRPYPTTNEIAIMKTIARFAAVVIERMKAQEERDQAQHALQSVNEELARMNKLKNDLIKAVSHEFRTSLTSIQGFSEMIRDNNLKIMEMKEFAADIYSDAKRLTRRINDMVDLDLMESRRSQLRLNWVDLNEVMLDVVVQMRKRVPEHAFRTHFAHVLPMMMGDRDALVRVVLSYLHNAIWYSPEGGEIVVSSMVEGNLIHVSVRDYGVGMQPDELQLLFERYAQIERPVLTHDLDQNDIDLPLARDIVEMHGGQVWAESIAGKGSVFHFTVQFTTQSVASFPQSPPPTDA